MAIALALFAALAYGVSDFVGGLISRRASAWAVAVLANLSSTVCVGVIAAFVPGEPTVTDFACTPRRPCCWLP